MKIIKQIIQYILPLVMAVLLLRYVYRDLSIDTLLAQLAQVKIGWIVVAVVWSLGSHWVRAYRWKLLLQSLNFYPSLTQAFLALLIGYGSNLFLPRLGELVRCTVLKKYTNIPYSTSLGTVVSERLIDLVSLLAVLGLTLSVAFQQLQAMLHEVIFTHMNPQALRILGWGSLVFVGFIGLLISMMRSNQAIQSHAWLLKLQGFSQGIWQGIISIQASHQKLAILFSTVLMWLLYYLAAYVGLLAIPETSNLSLAAGLAILAMSSVSLTLPVQGGIGAYHLLVSSTIMAYGISKEPAMLYVTVMHSSQLLMTLLAAGISLVAGLFYSNKTDQVSIN
ncbi:MAG: lysylphosphatidylglycerol synthase transmembrane domain-containing protein [Burkholderiales bacterium]